MKKARQLKRIARSRLKGRYWQTVVIGLMVNAVGIITSTYNVCSIYSAYLASGEDFMTFLSNYRNTSSSAFSSLMFLLSVATFPLFLGWALYNVKLIREEEPAFSDVISGYSYFLEYLALMFYRAVLVALWGAVFLVPAVIFGTLMDASSLVLLGFLGSVLICLYKIASYAMADYLMVDQKYAPTEAVKLSKELMRGKIWKFTVLNLSFIGYFLLLPFTLGIGIVFLFPYLSAAVAAFYEDARQVSPGLHLEAPTEEVFHVE